MRPRGFVVTVSGPAIWRAEQEETVTPGRDKGQWT
jgi:hypothetical protein